MKSFLFITLAASLVSAPIAFAKDHSSHGDHKHGPSCGHVGVIHDSHVDYLHDAHMHNSSDGKVAEHLLAVDATNPAACNKNAVGHDAKHKHGQACGHAAVPHGDHSDFLVGSEIHHAHEGHCDGHGSIKLATK